MMVIMEMIVIMVMVKMTQTIMLKIVDEDTTIAKKLLKFFFIAARTDTMEQSGGKNLTQTGQNM